MAGGSLGLRPLTSPDATRVCGLSGVQSKLYGEKLIRLKDLENTLLISIAEAEAAVKSEIFWTKAIIATRIVKVACDLTVDILSNATGPAGKGVSMIYDRAGLVVDGLNGQLDGAKVGQHVVETHVDVLSSSLEYMGKEKLGSAVGHTKTLVKTGQSVYEIYKDYKSLETAGEGTKGARQSLLHQLRRIREQIAVVERALADCGLE